MWFLACQPGAQSSLCPSRRVVCRACAREHQVVAPLQLLFRRSMLSGCRRVQDAVGNGMFGLLLCLALVYPSSCLVRGMVEEKETRMRETMCAIP